MSSDDQLDGLLSILEIIGKKLEGDLAVGTLQQQQKNQEEDSVI